MPAAKKAALLQPFQRQWQDVRIEALFGFADQGLTDTRSYDPPRTSLDESGNARGKVGSHAAGSEIWGANWPED